MERRGKESRRIRLLIQISFLLIVSTVGMSGYWFSKIVSELSSDAKFQSTQLLAVESALNDAAIAMAEQTQEWKDMLIRMYDPDLLAKHEQDFEHQQMILKSALALAQTRMEAASMNTADIQALRASHLALIEKYIKAEKLINPQSPLSFRDADKQVMGEDRGLRDDLNRLKRKIENQANARIAKLGITSEEKSRSHYYLLGMLGISLPVFSFILFYLSYRALREIGRADARVRAIHEAIGDAVVVTDINGRVESLNEMAQNLCGWTQEDARGQSLHEVLALFDANGIKRIASPVESVLRDGVKVPFANGMLLKSRDGTERAIEDSASPVLNEKGRMIGVVMVFHDVTQRHELLRELRQERALFSQTFKQAAVGMGQVDLNGHWLQVNHKLCEITGYEARELLNLTFSDITYPEDIGRNLDMVRDMLNGENDTYQIEKRYIRRDERIIWVNITVALVRKEDGTPDYFISVIEDIQSRKDAEQAANIARKQYQALFDQMPEGVILFDQAFRVLTCNREALLQLEYSMDEITGLHVWNIDANDDEKLVRARTQKLRESGSDDFESRYRTRSGYLIDVMISARTAVLPSGEEVFQYLIRDLREQKASARQIEHLAFYDQLTGMPNRRLLQDRLTQAINGAMRRNIQVAVLCLDLDHFKDVNDSMGHSFGDALLKVIAQRLQECARGEDTVARIGGDEFVVMLNDIAHSEDVAAIAQKIISYVSQPIRIEHEELRITPSIGISLYPQDGKDADILMKNADTALHQAKKLGRSTYHMFTESLHEIVAERLKIERLLRHAIENNEFEMYYQPKINLEQGQVTGCEALIRWNHVGMGLVSPAQFIPIAEQSHLINDIGIWVMREVCHQAAAWQKRGLRLTVAFNVSARQFMHPEELLRELANAIEQSGVDASMLQIEMTESLLLDPHGMEDVLQKICQMGIHLALDDFGTGYSSLSYLKRFPISQLKIDRSFVSDADKDMDDAQMVKTIIGMAHNLRMNVVAEGIETEGQRSLLCVYGCETGQGYHFSHPLPVDQFELFLLKNSNERIGFIG